MRRSWRRTSTRSARGGGGGGGQEGKRRASVTVAGPQLEDREGVNALNGSHKRQNLGCRGVADAGAENQPPRLVGEPRRTCTSSSSPSPSSSSSRPFSSLSPSSRHTPAVPTLHHPVIPSPLAAGGGRPDAGLVRRTTRSVGTTTTRLPTPAGVGSRASVTGGPTGQAVVSVRRHWVPLCHHPPVSSSTALG